MPNNIGAFGENFPYGNFHDMNMDWIIKIAKDFLDNYTSIQEQIQQSVNAGITALGEATSAGVTELEETTTTSLTELETKKNQLEALLDQWYNTHSADIANQLANAITELNAQVTNIIASIPQDYSKLSRMASDTKNTTLDSIKQFVENLPYIQLYPLFYQYGISGDTGLPNTDTSQTHSEFIYIGQNSVEFIPKNGYRLHVRYYQDRDYSTFVSSQNNVSGMFATTPANYMILVCTRNDFGTITPEESGGNVKIYSKNIYTGFIMSNESNSGAYSGNVNVDTINKIITFGASDSFCRLCYSGKIINIIGKTLDYSSFQANYAYILYNLNTNNFELNGATAFEEPTSKYVIVGTIWGNANTCINMFAYPCYYINGIRTYPCDGSYISSDVHTRNGDNVFRIGVLGDSISTYSGVSESSLDNTPVRNAYYPAGDVTSPSDMWFNQLRTMLRTGSDSIVSAISRSSFRDQSEPLQPPVWDNRRIARLRTLTNINYILLYCGVNEQYESDANIGTPTYMYDLTRLGNEPNTTCRGIELTIRKLQTEIPEAKIVIMIPPFTFGDTVTYPKPYTTFRKYINEISKTYGVAKIIDLSKCITPANRGAYTIDGIHPNKSGMKRIAHYVATELLTNNPSMDW